MFLTKMLEREEERRMSNTGHDFLSGFAKEKREETRFFFPLEIAERPPFSLQSDTQKYAHQRFIRNLKKCFSFYKDYFDLSRHRFQELTKCS